MGNRDISLEEFINEHSIFLEAPKGCRFKKVRPTNSSDKHWNAVYKKGKRNGTVIKIDYRKNPFVSFSLYISGYISIIRTHVDFHKKYIYIQVASNHKTKSRYRIVLLGNRYNVYNVVKTDDNQDNNLTT